MRIVQIYDIVDLANKNVIVNRVAGEATGFKSLLIVKYRNQDFQLELSKTPTLREGITEVGKILKSIDLLPEWSV